MLWGLSEMQLTECLAQVCTMGVSGEDSGDVCMCVSVHAYVCAYIMYACIFVYICVSMNICVSMYASVYACIHTCVCVFMCSHHWLYHTNPMDFHS